jgi:hypothetical protein
MEAVYHIPPRRAQGGIPPPGLKGDDRLALATLLLSPSEFEDESDEWVRVAGHGVGFGDDGLPLEAVFNLMLGVVHT